MGRRASRFSMAEVIAGIRAIEQAGHVLARVEVAPDGTLAFVTVGGLAALAAHGVLPATLQPIDSRPAESEIIDL